MIAILWSLAGAVAYGISDFIGAVAARRVSAWPVTLVTSLAGALAGVVLGLLASGHPSSTDFAWAALAGVGGGLGTAFLYRGLAAGRIGVVAPTSAVCAAALPVVVSTLNGEQPPTLAWIGMAAALPGIWMVSQEPGTSFGGPALVDGALAGLGFGLDFIALGHVHQSAGWWPIAVLNLVGAATVLIVAMALRQRILSRDPAVYWGIFGGILASGAMVAFVLATSRGLVSIASVMISLYPAVTIVLAVVFLHERVHRIQQFGLALCAGAVALVAASGQG